MVEDFVFTSTDGTFRKHSTKNGLLKTLQNSLENTWTGGIFNKVRPGSLQLY